MATTLGTRPIRWTIALAGCLALLFCMAVVQEVMAQQTGTVEGQVFDFSESPIPGASVSIPSLGIGTTTDQQGSYLLSSVPDGSWTVVASAQGFLSDSETVIIDTASEGGGEAFAFFLLEEASEGIAVSPETLDYGSATIGNTRVDSVGIENTGDTNVEILSVSVAGTNADAFVIQDDAVTGTLQAGQTRFVSIAFTPETTGQKQAKFELESSIGTRSASLTGVGAVARPTATTAAATNISDTSATLNGQVNPGGGETTVFFEYGLTPEYGSSVVASQSPISGTTTSDVDAAITGLEQGTTYHFRVVATNEVGEDAGGDQVFTTTESVLVVDPLEIAFGNVAVDETEQATVIIENGGNAALTIQGVALSGSADFSVSNDTQEPTLDPGQTRTVVIAFAPRSPGGKSAELTVQTPEEERVVALSGTGQIATPTATTEAATSVSARSAVLNGTVNPGGGETTVTFVYRVAGSDALQTIAADQSPVSGTAPVAVSATTSGLAPGTEYVFRVIAENDGGSASGNDESFETSIAAPTAATQAATGVRVQRAVLNGIVNPGGSQTTVTFQYRLAGSDDVQSVTAPQSPVNGADPVPVNAEVPGLQSQTEYAFRVVAENEAGSASSDEATFVTQPPAVAVEPSALDFGTLFLGRDSSRAIAFTNTGEQGFQIESVTIVDNSGGVFALTEPDPIPNQIGAGASIDLVVQFMPEAETESSAILQIESTGGDLSVSLTGAGAVPDVSAEAVTGTRTVGEPVRVAATPEAGFAPTQAQLFYRPGGAAAYEQTSLSETEGRFEGEIPANAVTERGVDYYVQFSDGITTATFPRENPQDAPVHLGIDVPQIVAEGPLQPGTYRMISVPLTLGRPGAIEQISDDLGEPGIDRWRLLRWNASSERYTEPPELNPSFALGRAYWLIASGDVLTGETGTQPPVDIEGGASVGGEAVPIQVQPGWNQIGVPFAFPVAWSAIENSSSVDGPVAFNPADEGNDPYQYGVQVLEPWIGYWVFNPSSSVLTLSVPPVAASTVGAEAPKQVAPFPFDVETDYALQLSATLSVAGSETKWHDVHNYVGLAAQASASSGHEDVAEAPPIGEHVRLSIVENGQRWAGNLRPAAAAGQVWEIEIAASVDEPFFRRKQVVVDLTDHGTRPRGYTLRAIDADRGVPLAIESNRFAVGLTPDRPTRRVRLVLGTASFAEQKTEDVFSTTALGAAYPNPFSASMTIEYRLNASKPVSLTVFDMLGRRVRTLSEGPAQPGVYTATWDGRNADGTPASSGVYVVRMQAGSFVATRRIVLVR